MPLSLRLALLLGSASLAASLALAAPPTDADAAAADEQTLRAADLPTDGPGLLDFLHRRALLDTDRLHIQTLIRKLGDDDFDVREKTTADLKAMGPAVRPMLREALQDPDPEVRFRAQRCLTSLDQWGQPAALTAAVRTVGRLRPAGAV